MNTYLRQGLVSTGMTLVIAAFNENTIVLGTATLARHTDDDGISNPINFYTNKMFPLGQDGAVLYSGTKVPVGVAEQLFADAHFTYEKYEVNSVRDRAHDLIERAETTLLKSKFDDFVFTFIVAGFENGKPALFYSSSFDSENNPYSLYTPVEGSNFLAAGLRYFGESAMREAGSNVGMDNRELRKAVRSAIEKCKAEKPDEIGGKIIIHSLYSS